jgi:hypothetical protein
MVFKLIYISGCLIACQNEQGPNLRNSLYNIPVTQFVFTNIPISIGGILETIPGITFMQVLYITPISKILFKKKCYRYSLGFSVRFEFGYSSSTNFDA